MATEWKHRAEALFFTDGKSIIEISELIGVSVRSISKHFNGLPEYGAEVERRKKANQNRTDYYREWKRNNRSERYHTVHTETMKQEHITAVKILSRERYF